MKNQYIIIPSLFVALFLFLFVFADAKHSDEECVYTMYVKTGSIIKGGTDSNISVTLSDAKGNSIWVPSLKSWGLMGSAHDYFERASLDAPICRLNLTSDASGRHHAWYCDYLELTSTGPHRPCSQTFFYVDQWLAKDVAPHNLTAVLDDCRVAALPRRHARFIVANRKLSST